MSSRATYTEFFTISPSAVNEGSEPPGALQSFLVDEAGTLTLVGTAESGGDGPTYVGSLSTGEIVGCNVSVMISQHHWLHNSEVHCP